MAKVYTLDDSAPWAGAVRMENELGSIEVGKKAALVVLDLNIFNIDLYTIHKTGVVMTMMYGEIVYRTE